MAIRLARGLGAGMGQGSVCGAVTGAAMVLGLATADRADEQEARYVTYDLVGELTERFAARRGTISCRELLGGVDLATEEGRREAERLGLFHSLCPDIVREAADVLSELTSGAGHDTMVLGRLCPAAMCFIPSTGGSHSPREFAEWEACVAGADVLLRATVDRARAAAPGA